MASWHRRRVCPQQRPVYAADRVLIHREPATGGLPVTLGA